VGETFPRPVKLDPENEARLYEATWAQLAAAGYAQYEVSNFARPGHACRHNLNTWHMNEWVGLGPSAASQHDGWRGGNIADLEKWLAHVAAGERVTEDRVAVTPSVAGGGCADFWPADECGRGCRRVAGALPGCAVAGGGDVAGALRGRGACGARGFARATDRSRAVAGGLGGRGDDGSVPIPDPHMKRFLASLVFAGVASLAFAAEHSLVIQTDFGTKDGAVAAMKGGGRSG